MFNSKNIRPVKSDDLSELQHVIKETGLFPPEMLEQMMKPMLTDSECLDIWRAYENNNVVIAVALCEPDRIAYGTWNLLALAVLPEFQGSGIGSLIVKHVEDVLRTQGQRILIIETSGLSEFSKTRSFYEKIGYVQEARIRDFYEPGDDKIVFWKSLV